MPYPSRNPLPLVLTTALLAVTAGGSTAAAPPQEALWSRDTKGWVFVDPAVAGDVLYIGSCSGRLFAYDAASGEERWSYDTGADARPPGQFHGQLVVVGDAVVAGTDTPMVGHLYAFDRGDGTARWKLQFPRGVAVDVVHRDGDLFFASEVGDVGRVRLADGEWVWHADAAAGAAGDGAGNGAEASGGAGGEAAGGGDLAEAESGRESGATPARPLRPLDPVLVGDRLVVAWRSGQVDAYAVEDGRRLWRRDLGGDLNAHPVVVGGQVVVGTFAGRLLRLSPADGEVSGELELGGALYGDLVATPGCLLTLSARGGYDPARGALGPHALVCVEPDLGGVRWAYRDDAEWGTFRPRVAGDVVLAGVADRLMAFDLGSGEMRWELPIRGLPRGLAVSGDRLFVGTQPGPVVAFPWPRRGAAPDSPQVEPAVTPRKAQRPPAPPSR